MLQQSAPEIYPESYYDESSPHYLGGNHNVALQQLKDGNIPRKYAEGAQEYASMRLKQASEETSVNSYM